MKVLLKSDVPKIGKKGELLDVKEGYARNFLIPNGLAIEATGGTMKQYEEEKKAGDRRKAKEKEDAQALGAKLKGSRSRCVIRPETREGFLAQSPPPKWLRP